MNKITVSAPGKLMLLGEYAVLYNKPCLVTAVDKRLYATVEIIDRPEFQLEAPDVKISGYEKSIRKLGLGSVPNGAGFVESAVVNLIKNHRLIARSNEILKQVQNDKYKTGIRITTKSDFSSELGFGSSSASTVCIVKGLSELFNLRLSDKEIFDICYKTVLDIQGKGSGFDTAAAVYGGTLYFATGGRIIESLDIIKPLPLVVGYSGIKADTVQQINKVKKNFYRKAHIEKIYNDIEDLVNRGKEVIIKSDWRRFGMLMNQNQEYLRELGVSSEKLDNMINAALSAGAYGAKLSGAGGGDCMIAIAPHDKEENVKNGIIRAGGEIINVETNALGVRVE